MSRILVLNLHTCHYSLSPNFEVFSTETLWAHFIISSFRRLLLSYYIERLVLFFMSLIVTSSLLIILYIWCIETFYLLNNSFWCILVIASCKEFIENANPIIDVIRLTEWVADKFRSGYHDEIFYFFLFWYFTVSLVVVEPSFWLWDRDTPRNDLQDFLVLLCKDIVRL
jgi:hypothetical protein